MKIINENKVYLQKKDFGFLDCSTLPILAPIHLHILGQGPVIITSHNEDEFLEFTDPTAMNYVRALDFIIDIDDIRDKSIRDLEESLDSLIKQESELAARLNAMSQTESYNHQDMFLDHDILVFRISELEYIIQIKSGKKTTNLPDGVDPIPVNKKPDFTKKFNRKEDI